jgi:hypothetical protein
MFSFQLVAWRKFDPVAALQELVSSQPNLIREKQRLIRENVFRLQYSLETPHQLAALKLTNLTWPLDRSGEPQEDAFDRVINLALGWHSGRLSFERNATVPRCMSGRRDSSGRKCVKKIKRMRF